LRGREIWLVVDEMSRVMRYEEMNESHLALFGSGEMRALSLASGFRRS